MNFKILLLLSQIYIHISFIIGLLIIPTLPIVVSIAIGQILFVGLCGTVFYHRIITHKNNINRFAENILLLLSWIGVSGSAIAWAGTHRKHHRYSDTERDPHSPKHIGFIKTYWWSSGGGDIIRYVPDLLKRQLFVWQHKWYFHVLVVLHIFCGAILPYTLYWCTLIVPALLMWFSGSMVNCVSHDNLGPKNNKFVGLIFAGEGWHKNHHGQPGNPMFHNRLDWGYWIYKALNLKKTNVLN